MRIALLLLAGTAACAAADAQEQPVVPLGPIEVIGAAPLPGLGTPLAQVPSNVQTFGVRALGRVEASADAGVNRGGLAGFAAFESIDEDGWRDHASTRIRRLYARLDGREESNEFNVAVTVADNHLEGTQALPVSMLSNPRQAYTWPDTTDNRLAFASANAQHGFDADTLLA